jgi:hypothetical protein
MMDYFTISSETTDHVVIFCKACAGRAVKRYNTYLDPVSFRVIQEHIKEHWRIYHT